MKTRLAIFGILTMSVCKAAPFVNLTFDQPDLSGSLTPVYPGGPLEGEVAKILNGWTLSANGKPQAHMTYSPLGTSTSGIATLDENSAADKQTHLGPYSLILEPPVPNPPDVRVSQTGTIPADAVGLWIGSAGPVEMFVNGTKVDDPRIGTFSNVIVDISSFSGQTVDLGFRVVPGFSTRFDMFGFTPIPEPSNWALFGVGAAAILFFSRQKK
jgi:hypothetical protein